jgi:hypothetical protein
MNGSAYLFVFDQVGLYDVQGGKQSAVCSGPIFVELLLAESRFFLEQDNNADAVSAV